MSVVVAVTWGGPALSQTNKLTVMTVGGDYGDALKTAYFDPFAKATGIQVGTVLVGDPIPQVQAQVQSGNVLWDAVICNPTDALSHPDLWQPIDRSIVKSTGDLATQSEIGQFFITDDLEISPVLAYSKKAFHVPPKSWADFYDFQRFPGSRGVPNLGLNSAWRLPATALLADGVAPDKLVPFDLDRAYKKLDELKPHIRAYYTGFTAGQDLLRSGEVVMDMLTDGRTLAMIKNGDQVGIVYNQGFLFKSGWCTPKGAPNAQNAMRLYEFILSHPEQQAVFSSVTLYGPPTKSAVPMAKKLGVLDTSTAHVNELIPDTPALARYIIDHSQELLDRWNTFMAK